MIMKTEETNNKKMEMKKIVQVEVVVEQPPQVRC